LQIEIIPVGIQGHSPDLFVEKMHNRKGEGRSPDILNRSWGGVGRGETGEGRRGAGKWGV